jgi:hypothetical protein
MRAAVPDIALDAADLLHLLESKAKDMIPIAWLSPVVYDCGRLSFVY